MNDPRTVLPNHCFTADAPYNFCTDCGRDEGSRHSYNCDYTLHLMTSEEYLGATSV